MRPSIGRPPIYSDERVREIRAWASKNKASALKTAQHFGGNYNTIYKLLRGDLYTTSGGPLLPKKNRKEEHA